MALTDTLNKNVTGFGVLGITIVIMSIVLLKFKDGTGQSLCDGGNGVAANLSQYNTTLDLCCYANTTYPTGSCILGNGTPTVITDLGTWVSALSEPKNWVAIVIIALIGFAVLKMFTGKKK